MTSLDDRLYQLFSDLLKNSKQHEGLTFDGQSLATGDGPYLTSQNGQNSTYLGPRASLLGHGHPLTYKNRLLSSLRPEVYCSEVEQEGLVEDLTNFLQSVIGPRVYVTFNPTDAIPIYDAGRHQNFLSERSYKLLNEGKVVLIPNLFPFPLYLGNTPLSSSTPSFLTSDALIAATALLKLLKLGDFYGEQGHIQRISKELKDELKNIKSVRNIDGLLIHLEQDRNYSFLDEGQDTIYLPLFFRPTFIKELKKIIMD